MASSSGHKTLYMNSDFCHTGSSSCYMLFEGSSAMRLTRDGTNFDNQLSSYGYSSLMGGANSGDNTWHCFEYHWKAETTSSNSNGVFEWWLDGTLRYSHTSVDYNTTGAGNGFAGFTLPNNGDFTTPGGNAAAIDYDDIALSVTQRIGGTGCGS